MVLIDTSAWIHFLRTDGAPDVRARVEAALRSGEACWCAIVRLELWNGAGGDKEKKILRQFESRIPSLEIDAAVWDHACDLARRCRAAGVTVPAVDIAIAACARCHGATLEHADGDFAQIADVADATGEPTS
jgi:predicted nucleic acid-binding protein